MMKCRCCHRDDVLEVMTLDGVPKDVQHLLSFEDVGRGKTHSSDISIYQCQDCGLVQAPLKLDQDYYDDYLMTTSFSDRLQTYLDDLVTQFLTEYAKNVRKVLDVGCGDGAFMQPFRNRKIKVEGIEPSRRSREEAKKAGFQVYSGYMTPDTRLKGAPYDAFVTRQVLEHVDDIQGFFRGLRNNLSPGAYGVVEIPRLEKALSDLRFYDFFPDHVNYFTLESLRTVLEINGFTVLGMGSVMDDEYNVAIVQMRDRHDFSSVKKHRADLIKDISRLVRAKKKSRVAMWGAGAKGLSILAAMAERGVTLDMVVDSDANKVNRFTPISEILVHSPEFLLTEQIDTVLISAIAYERAIIQKLQDMRFPGEIYLIRSQGLELYKETK